MTGREEGGLKWEGSEAVAVDVGDGGGGDDAMAGGGGEASRARKLGGGWGGEVSGTTLSLYHCGRGHSLLSKSLRVHHVLTIYLLFSSKLCFLSRPLL